MFWVLLLSFLEKKQQHTHTKKKKKHTKKQSKQTSKPKTINELHFTKFMIP